MSRVTVVGEVLLDMLPDGAGFRPVVGGGPLNAAVASRRLGCDVSLMARRSRSGLGDRVREHLARADLDLEASVDVDAPTTLAFVVLAADGSARYDFYTDGTADWGWQRGELDAVPVGTSVVHTGSLVATLAPSAQVLLEAFDAWRQQGELLLSYDPNVRPSVAGDRDAAVRRTEAYVGAAHLVKVSDEDLAWLHPGHDPVDVCRRWAGLGPDLVVLTSGADAVRGFTRDGVAADATPPRVAVADTIGAGDTCAAALLAWLVRHDLARPGALAGLDADTLAGLLAYAATAAALTCERTGAQPPTHAEVVARLDDPPHVRETMAP